MCEEIHAYARFTFGSFKDALLAIMSLRSPVGLVLEPRVFLHAKSNPGDI